MKQFPHIVVGAGAGGLVVAIGLARANKQVLLIDKGTWGGDCTNFGCIPSKTLIHLAKTSPHENPFPKIKKIVDEIRSHEDPKALEKLGVETREGSASFLDPYTLKLEKTSGSSETVQGKKIILATGSKPRLPFDHLEENEHIFTNETIFSLKSVPKSLLILGAGPIGAELAFAFSKCGTSVSIVTKGTKILPKEDEEVSPIIEQSLKNHGVHCHFRKNLVKITGNTLHFEDGSTMSSEKILVAIGREPNLSSLNLNLAGIAAKDGRVAVDNLLRTRQKHIFAIGDVASKAMFTHLAENQGRVVLKNLLLPWPFKTPFNALQSIPRATFTDPEVAAFGLSSEAAEKRYGKRSIKTYFVSLDENDRAKTEERREGFVKIVTKKWSSRILGATIVAPLASEMILEPLMAKHYGIPLRKLSSLIHPYPTYSLATRKASDNWLREVILGL